jgi:hypothetical protein
MPVSPSHSTRPILWRGRGRCYRVASWCRPNFSSVRCVLLVVKVESRLVGAALLCAWSSGCGLSGSCVQPQTDGPCLTYPHHWSGHEVARDVQSIPFPPAADARDRLYGTVCRIEQHGTRAVCTGVRRHGPRPNERVTVRMLLRINGSLSLLCWPQPSSLCDPVQIKEQRAHPVTS